ncbi:hypothetical protein GCM10022631_10870 [Deinococcus rubellus]|uniref:HD domain-containing phosphohydrolase n=1 Tax=Deinococcus rubellus TaxID=1889240 RepID=UPI0031EBEDA9
MHFTEPTETFRVFDSILNAIFVLDAQGRFVFANTSALQTWRSGADQVLGRRLEDGLPYQIDAQIIDVILNALQTQEHTEFECFLPNEHYWVVVIIYPYGGGVIVHVRRLLRNAMKLNEVNRDALTGCMTRQALLEYFPQNKLPQLLVLIDLNRLKAVNTTRGHSGGDQYIRQVAQAILAAMPPEAMMCRWGGDEFVLLVPEEKETELEAALLNIQAGDLSPFPGIPPFSVGMSLWVPEESYERAFALADERLQYQKQQLNHDALTGWEPLTFVRFSQQLEALQDPDEIIQYALQQLLLLLNFDSVLYVSWDPEEIYVRHQITRPGFTPLEMAMNSRRPLFGLALKVRETQRTAWSTDYPSESEAMPTLLEQGVKSVIVTPVRSQGRIVASLNLMAVDRWHTVTPQARDLVELVALRLEHALELRRVVREVRATLEAGLLALGLALEARDLETHGHTQRVANLAVQLGVALGLPPQDVDRLQEGAYLHDLGKLAVPDAILKKPGKLTPEEWSVMQTHVMQGWELAARIPNLAPAVLGLIRHHHELWDGTGYPDGLAGTTIPLLARIFTVCDVYDALISERPYKQAWSHADALQEIEHQSGRHFDPEVVQAFLSLKRDEQAVQDGRASGEGMI